ncbi:MULTISPECIES: GNAT family N-acetyltransferase [unclassified Shinella]|jgi:GNAT superfamily N-acetyltransferase|uniref:GNAT family N-acetyltransferase n=1 Tax=unclassified Shinella TaxID=2643062 RepID=UPI0009EABB3A|nr:MULTISPECIES: GNAT family N-acetyltransferase [unclassified Shinella]
MTEPTNLKCQTVSAATSEPVEIRAVAPMDEAAWRKLYRAYAAFYRVPMTENVLDRTWAWLRDPAHPLEGLVAVTGELVVGFAHYWPQPRPLLGRDAGFLDDLFVDPSQRSRGIGRLLLEALNETSRARDWAMLSWVTAQDNATARRLYDDVAKAANWVTYELTP